MRKEDSPLTDQSADYDLKHSLIEAGTSDKERPLVPPMERLATLGRGLVRVALTAYLPARTLHDRGEVGAVGLASSRGIRGQLRSRSISEPLRPCLVAAGSMGDRHADLRQPLPKVTFVARPGLPARFQNLMGGERTAGLHEFVSCPQRLLRRQRLLRDRLNSLGAVRQWPTQLISRPGLSGTPERIAVSLRSTHDTSVSGNASDCRATNVVGAVLAPCPQRGNSPIRDGLAPCPQRGNCRVRDGLGPCPQPGNSPDGDGLAPCP